ncbi:MAG: hypothetical protein APU95_04445 [Hadesarchaea archaeon YNP_N21]|nr:MAG: hypothetical protein APU95_04445 [Hadesarchaea archaeon YNP_N21]
MNSLNVAFRVDGNTELGMGHLTRCLALARAMREITNINILFITKGHKEAVAWISEEKQPMRVIPLGLSENEELALVTNLLKKFKPDVIVTDLPYTTDEYLRRLKECGKLMVSIDDLALVTHCADLVVSGYLSAKLKKYRTTNPNTKFLIGTEYLMLQKKFEKMNRVQRKARKNARSVLVTLGGADPENLTIKVVKALSKIDRKLDVTVVLGPAYTHQEELQKLLKKLKTPKSKFRIKSNVKNMAKLMMKTDIAITAGGETIYELAAVGTPSINISQVEHQSINAQELERAGTVINLGLGRKVSEEQISSTVLRLLDDKNLRQKMSLAGKRLVDGKGAKRVADIILKTLKAQKAI